MALFIRSTKTRVWCVKGTITITPFINAEKERSITISLLAADGKKHSITLYNGEIEHLEYMLTKSVFSLKST